jgi:hypothetical protein
MTRLITQAWRAVRARPLLGAVALVVVLAVVLPIGNYLLSPLWTRTTLNEASPLSVGAGAPTANSNAVTSTTATSSPAASGSAATPSAVSTVTVVASTPAVAGTAAVPASTPAATSAGATATTATPSGGPRLVARGTFRGADDFHFGRGDALLIELAPQRHAVRFENFSVRNGPDLYVYLSDDPNGYGGAVLKLGRLRATDGAFNYDLPPGTDISRYRSAIVWCDQFSQLFATASLR